MRKKNCANCKKEFDVLYRAQYQSTTRLGVFMQKLPAGRQRRTIPLYRYGGTWKK